MFSKVMPFYLASSEAISYAPLETAIGDKIDIKT
jgi:hypothetical protein